MKLAIVTGTVTATAKDPQLVGQKLLVCDCIDASGKVTEPALVATDSLGAGVGNKVLVVTGSAARMLSGTSGVPVDAAICGIIDQVEVTSK